MRLSRIRTRVSGHTSERFTNQLRTLTPLRYLNIYISYLGLLELMTSGSLAFYSQLISLLSL